jgi:hypothetical protein
MKASLPRPQHESYLEHRRQNVSQVLVPVILGAVLIVAAAIWIGVAAFGGNGDSAKWAAVSTIWIVLPLMFASLLFTALLAALVYLMSRFLNILPGYTGKAQDFAYRLKSLIRKFLDALVKPVFALDEIGSTLKALIGRR